MSKNLNKIRNMAHAKYYKWIKGDEISLRRIMLMYEDLNPELQCTKKFIGYEYIDDEDGYYTEANYEKEWKLLFNVEMSVWNNIVKNLGLKVNKEVRQKREWKIA